MSETERRYRAGGWSTRRGKEEGILVYGSTQKDKVAMWFDKTTATRFAHTVLEAQIRFWDILWYPDEIRDKVEGLAQRIGMEVKEPYREGCPFCQHVSDSEDDMREHLKDEHEIHIVIVETEEE